MKTIINTTTRTTTTNESVQPFFLSFKNSKRIQWSAHIRYSL